MKTTPIVPACIELAGDGPPRAPAYDDLYHPRAGALAQARHVFLGGNGLPGRWQGAARFVILETGFGLGNNFLATWEAWRQDPQRCERLVFVSIEKHPPRAEDLERLHVHSPLAGLAQALVQSWPPLTAGLHPLPFEDGRVTLLLALGDVAALLPELRARADAFYLDGFAPARNPQMWDERVIKALGRMARPGATLATWSVARAVGERLQAAGFEVSRAPGLADKREMTVARFAPRFTPRGACMQLPLAAPGQVTVLGAGLAGACTARALAERGVQVTVIDRHHEPAGEASGNRGGLFHGTVHEDDGPHARWLRAGSLWAARRFAQWVRDGTVPGALEGLLRLEPRAGALERMRALIERQGWPDTWVQALDPVQAGMAAGANLKHPAWRFAQAGWLSPATLARQLLDHPRIRFEPGVVVSRLARHAERWQLQDGQGHARHDAGTLVLANAAGALPLLQSAGLPGWPLNSVRGQVTVLPAQALGGWKLHQPLTGQGYALSLPDGSLLCGASSQHDDDDPAVRESDHAFNLRRLHALTGLTPALDAATLAGRTGWRVQVPDRLPVAGAMPAATTGRWTRMHELPRAGGLFALNALGGRGLSWGPLLGELLAAQISGDPWPVEASLAEAVDPARWLVRAARQGEA